jgi:hypothetical protein
MSDIDLLADARAWLATQGDRIQTHGELCHRWHPACLVSRLLSRAGQSDGKTRHFDADVPERDNAAPAFWVVIMDGEQADNEWTYRKREAADEAAAYILSHAPDAPVRVVPLVLLTAEDREAIDEAAAFYGGVAEDEKCQTIAATLRGLLARTSAGGNRQ